MVTFEAAGSGVTATNATTSISWTQVVTTGGPNSILVGGCAYYSSGSNFGYTGPPTSNLGGPFTFANRGLGDVAGVGTAEVGVIGWMLHQPVAGTHTLTLSFGGTLTSVAANTVCYTDTQPLAVGDGTGRTKAYYSSGGDTNSTSSSLTLPTKRPDDMLVFVHGLSGSGAGFGTYDKNDRSFVATGVLSTSSTLLIGDTLGANGGTVTSTVGLNASSIAWRNIGFRLPSPGDLWSPLIRISSATAAATTLTMPAHQAGDMLVMWAHNKSSTTVPTLPAGWSAWPTTPSASGNTNAARLAYKFAASSSETSGTWTSATSLICVNYRNASGPSTAVAWTNSVGTTMTYPALSNNATNDNSVIFRAGAHRTATNLGQGLASTTATSAISAWAFAQSDPSHNLTFYDGGYGNLIPATSARLETVPNSGWTTVTAEVLGNPPVTTTGNFFPAG